MAARTASSRWNRSTSSGVTGFADMLRRMSRTAFGGRELGEAFEVLSAMAADPDCTIVVTVSGAMTIAKMGRVLCEMIDAALAHVVISTGAIIAHGLSESRRRRPLQARPERPRRATLSLGLQPGLRHGGDGGQPAPRARPDRPRCSADWDWSRPICSWELNREIGRRLVRSSSQMPSILGCAYPARCAGLCAGLDRFGTGPERRQAQRWRGPPLSFRERGRG